MADAVNTVRQGVQQEAADELTGIEGHLSGPAAVAIVAPAEGHPAVLHADQAGIGDGHTMGIAAKMARTCSGPPKGGLA